MFTETCIAFPALQNPDSSYDMSTAGNNLINMGITNILPEGRGHFPYFLMFSWIIVLFHQFLTISATQSCITLLNFYL